MRTIVGLALALLVTACGTAPTNIAPDSVSTTTVAIPTPPPTSRPSAASVPAPSATYFGGPPASEKDMAEAPRLRITKDDMLLDGVPLAKVGTVSKLERIEPLFGALKERRDQYEQVHHGTPFPGVLILDIDEAVPAIVVKSAFQTAAFAGYPNVHFTRLAM